MAAPRRAVEDAAGRGEDQPERANVAGYGTLECPTYFALHGNTATIAYLARQQVEVLAPIRTDVEHIVVGRPLERVGRKGVAATALLEPDGTVLAHGECLFVEPRS